MVKLGDIFVALGLKRDSYERGLDDAEKRARSWTSGVSSFITNAFSYAVGGAIQGTIGGITSAVGNLREAMIGGNAAFEQYGTQFSVLLGNTELAQRRMEELARFGAETPFDLPGVVEADRILQGFGLHAADAADRFGKSGEEIRRIAGDVASGTGASFQELSALLGRFASGDTGDAIRRMQELGITTREELRGMGVEFDKAGSLVTPIDEAFTVILQIMQDKYGGMMEAQSRTFSGMLSNLRDWVGNTLRILGQPIFDKLKDGLQVFLEFVQPGGPADNAIKQFAETIRLTIGILSDLVSALVGDAGGSINSFVESLGRGLEQVNAFLRQLRDEIAGLTAADILGQLPEQLDAIDQRLNKSLDDLRTRHESTIAKLEGQLQTAGDRLGEAMAEVAEKYGPKISRLEEKIAETAGDLQERIADAAETFAKRRAKIEEEIVDRQSKLEEQLTELKADHERRRRQLSTSLLTAQSEEEYLRIQDAIRAEDDKYKQQTDKAKEAGKEQTSDLKARLKEEEAEYTKQNKRLERQRDRTLRDLRRQLEEVTAERDKETETIQEEYDKQAELLNNKLAAEKTAYEQQQAEIRALFAEQTAALEAETAARAAAIGQGPAAQIGEAVRTALDWLDRLKASIREFVTGHAAELKGALLAIGAVLLGAGLVAGISALVGVIGTLLSPIGLLVAAVAGLGAAWAGNWGDIQGKTQAVLEFLQPYWEQLKEILVNFYNETLPKLQAVWQTIVEVWNEELAPALAELLEALGLSTDAGKIIEGVLWLVEKALKGVTLAVQTLSPIIRFWADGVRFAIDQARTFINSLKDLSEWAGGLFDTFDGLLGKIKDLGEQLPEIELPWWMTPGSPTPWEVGLRGVGDALDKLKPKLRTTIDLQSAGLTGGNQTNIGRVEFNQTNQIGGGGGDDVRAMLAQMDERTRQLVLNLLMQYNEEAVAGT